MVNRPSPVWHPFTQHGLREPIPRIARAEGARLFASDGRAYIDAISSWWVITHGHCHPRIQSAIHRQAHQLDQLIFAGWTHEPAETLARALVELTPAALQHVFYSDSGSTSVEVALKMALGYWRNRGEPRHRIVVMENAYHGDTIGAMSVGARVVFNQAYEPLLFDVTSIPFPQPDAAQVTIDALEATCSSEAKPAAFICEPLVLGAGGMLIYAPPVLTALREVCRHHGVLFIADEVMTGWGRTGTLFACQQADVAPDLLCLSKGLTGGALPLAVTMATSAIFKAHCSTDRAQMFFHSSSFTANPIACAAANANIDVWLDESVEARISALSKHQEAELAAIADHPSVRSPRQLGTIAAFDIEVATPGYLSSLGPALNRFAMERGVLLRPLGNTVYVMPPYCTSAADLAQVYATIREGLDRFCSAPTTRTRAGTVTLVE